MLSKVDFWKKVEERREEINKNNEEWFKKLREEISSLLESHRNEIFRAFGKELSEFIELEAKGKRRRNGQIYTEVVIHFDNPENIIEDHTLRRIIGEGVANFLETKTDFGWKVKMINFVISAEVKGMHHLDLRKNKNNIDRPLWAFYQFEFS